MVVEALQETTQGLTNQGSPQGRFNPQLPMAKAPLKLPFVVASSYFTLNPALAPGLVSDADIGGGFRDTGSHGTLILVRSRGS